MLSGASSRLSRILLIHQQLTSTWIHARLMRMMRWQKQLNSRGGSRDIQWLRTRASATLSFSTDWTWVVVTPILSPRVISIKEREVLSQTQPKEVRVRARSWASRVEGVMTTIHETTSTLMTAIVNFERTALLSWVQTSMSPFSEKAMSLDRGTFPPLDKATQNQPSNLALMLLYTTRVHYRRTHQEWICWKRRSMRQ